MGQCFLSFEFIQAQVGLGPQGFGLPSLNFEKLVHKNQIVCKQGVQTSLIERCRKLGSGLFGLFAGVLQYQRLGPGLWARAWPSSSSI